MTTKAKTPSGAVLADASAILAIDDTLYAEVAVPEWGGTIRVRSMNALEFEQNASLGMVLNQDRTVGMNADLSRNAHLVAWCAVDPNGRPLFTAKDAAARLARKNAGVIKRVSDRIRKLSGVADEDAALEAAAGNSEAAPSAATPSA